MKQITRFPNKRNRTQAQLGRALVRVKSNRSGEAERPDEKILKFIEITLMEEKEYLKYLELFLKDAFGNSS